MRKIGQHCSAWWSCFDSGLNLLKMQLLDFPCVRESFRFVVADVAV